MLVEQFVDRLQFYPAEFGDVLKREHRRAHQRCESRRGGAELQHIIQSDIGGYPPWTGYLLFLQTARALEKLPPISYNDAIGPDRIATPGNAVNVLTTGGWGTSWVNGFRNLLGLPSLSGSALTAASTLNGAMTATP